MLHAEQKLNISMLILLRSLLQECQVALMTVTRRLIFLLVNLIVKLHLDYYLQYTLCYTNTI